ncbi:MAG: EAL domain-containing protein, partial [Gammaproteobacteria bacterium]
MSLNRQLWFGILLLMLVSFGGSAVINAWSARGYLETQISVKNADTAAALAAALAQYADDPVALGQSLAAQFDTGFYRAMTLVDPNGVVLIDLQSGQSIDGAPVWFQTLLPLAPDAGIAQVQAGWQPLGTLTVASHAGYAYQSLWQGTLRLLLWCGLAALLAGGLGTVLLRLLLRPLRRVVQQAQAIGERRFVITDEPRTPELGQAVRAMNQLVGRVQTLLQEESERLDQLLQQTHHDHLTGACNREHFIARLRAVLGRDDAAARGALVIARVLDLQGLNRRHGWPVLDLVLKRWADALRALPIPASERLLGRLNGSELCLLVLAEEAPEDLARRVQQTLQQIATALDLQDTLRLCVAGTVFHYGESLNVILSRADAALASVDGNGSGVAVMLSAEAPVPALLRRRHPDEWRQHIETALAQSRVRLVDYPVISAEGVLLHRESVARMRLGDDGEWLDAREFLPWMARFGDLPRFDQQVLQLALDNLRDGGAATLCVNLLAQSLGDASADWLASCLAAEPALAERLWIEIPDTAVFQHFDLFRGFCARLKPLGCRIGIEHMGHQVARIAQLYELGVDYLKIDAAFVLNIDRSTGNQIFLRGLLMMAHAIGVQAIAEGVATRAELDTVFELGLDGAT